MEDIFSSYLKKHNFDMEHHRDNRLRAHHGKQYDHRKGGYDWDFQFNLKEILPHIHQREYKDWRENGVAHEVRLGSNAIPNRTMSSYMPGEDKKSRDKIMVRGFWGDII